MTYALRLFAETLQISFLHIRRYELDYRWRDNDRKLAHTVIWLPQRGQFTLRVDGVRHEAKAGDLIVMGAGSSLSFRAVSSELTLDSINFEAFIGMLPNTLWTDALRLPVYTPGGGEEVAPIVRDMLETAGRATAADGLLLQAGLLRIVASMIRAAESAAGRPETDRSDRSAAGRGLDGRVAAVIDYLTARHDLYPDAAALAALVGVSESHLRKLFHDNTGLSPLQFVQSVKLQEAKRRLAKSGDRVSQIAYELGFRDANYFTRLFKEKTGCTPQAYRQQLQMFV